MTAINSWIARLKGEQRGKTLESPPQTETQAPLSYTPAQIASAMYRGLLERDPDPGGLAELTKNLETGQSLEEALHTLIDSGEFQMRALHALLPGRTRSHLQDIIPDHYVTEVTDYGHLTLVFKAEEAADFQMLERLMSEHGYYDQPGVWGSKIDLDKQVIAAIVAGLGAKSCLEIGCFTGAVLSILATKGLEVCGVDSSHLAFMLAYPNIRPRLRFGDILSLDLGGPFDCIWRWTCSSI